MKSKFLGLTGKEWGAIGLMLALFTCILLAITALFIWDPLGPKIAAATPIAILTMTPTETATPVPLTDTPTLTATPEPTPTWTPTTTAKPECVVTCPADRGEWVVMPAGTNLYNLLRVRGWQTDTELAEKRELVRIWSCLPNPDRIQAGQRICLPLPCRVIAPDLVGKAVGEAIGLAVTSKLEPVPKPLICPPGTVPNNLVVSTTPGPGQTAFCHAPITLTLGCSSITSWQFRITGGVKSPQHLPLAGVEVCFCASGETPGQSCSDWKCTTTKSDPPEKRGIYEVSYSNLACRVPSQYRVRKQGWVPIEGAPMPPFGGDCMQEQILLHMDPITLMPVPVTTRPIWVNLWDLVGPVSGTAWCSFQNPRDFPATAVEIPVSLNGKGSGEIQITPETADSPLWCYTEGQPPEKYLSALAKVEVEEDSFTLNLELEPVLPQVDTGQGAIEFIIWRNGWNVEDGPARVVSCIQEFPGGLMVYHSEVAGWGDDTIYVLWSDGTFIYGADDRVSPYETGFDWFRYERMTETQRNRLGAPLAIEHCEALEFNWFAEVSDSGGRVIRLLWPHPRWPQLLQLNMVPGKYRWREFQAP